jgi:hypothetical protein
MMLVLETASQAVMIIRKIILILLLLLKVSLYKTFIPNENVDYYT